MRHRSDLDTFRSWLARVADKEFADELVLAATAQYLRICIRTVPFTPSDSFSPWAIMEHPCQDIRTQASFQPDDVITLGNDNVHYVVLDGRN